MMRVTFLTVFLCVLLLFISGNESTAQNENQFTNPILAGFYPDPSICRVKDDYYLVTSTFAYFPGIPIFHSKDLTNWTLIGHVLDRPEQLNLDGFGVSRGIFAPTIRFYKDRYYVTCTLVDGGGNFIVTAPNPTGPWSDPVWIPEINGIDPSMFFDKDGSAYIIYNSIAPDDKPLYNGHRTIRCRAMDLKQLKVVGKEIILVNGGTDISKKPIWIEAPHIFQKDGFYYLIAAEGGTGDQHSEVVFRSKNVTGPYNPHKHNPILTQRHLNPERNFPITSTGHADFIETPTGEWWAVFLGCRPYPPYKGGYYNTGRETFLAPVRWEDGWPIINPELEEVQHFYPSPLPDLEGPADNPYSGNFHIRDDFNSENLHPDWVFLRTPHEKWYNLQIKKGFLMMALRPESCAENVNPSFIGRRQQHAQGSVSTSLHFNPKSDNEKAGLLVFQNESHFYFLCKSMDNHEPVIQLYRSIDHEKVEHRIDLIATQKLIKDRGEKELYLKIEAHGNSYSFLYGYSPDKFDLLKDKVDGKFLSTRVAGGFVGCIYALYATSLGKPGENMAYFDWFEYEGDDEVYKQSEEDNL